MQAVLTGDIVNSTKLSLAKGKTLVKILEQVLKPFRYEFYRGDSFQVLMKDAGSSLRIALLCRTAAISIAEIEKADVKISIGLGDAGARVTTLGSAKGEAFVLSGRAFDEMEKTTSRLVITSADVTANISFQIIADYINSIYSRMTSKQAKVIFELLKGNLQQDVVKRLKKSKSTISQHVSSGRWPEIEKILNQYELLVKTLH
ncbi:MAG: hypothetical protein M3Z92_15235 [Bacteroidota bacterium]|nr:hypothetical protein [Bacteroidota bacterium]MDQ6888928.1 hypothetical protein [Bacteroidota bacterium]